MEPSEKLGELVQEARGISKKLDRLFDDRERNGGKLERRLNGLPCRENEKDIKKLDGRLRLLEVRADNGNKLDEECRHKNVKMTRLEERVTGHKEELVSHEAGIQGAMKKNAEQDQKIASNRKKNVEQENRYRTFTNRMWALVVSLLTILFGGAIVALFKQYWTWGPKG